MAQEHQLGQTEDALDRAYAELAEDPQGTDVELFLAAQREVIVGETERQSPPSGQSTDAGSTASPREAET